MSKICFESKLFEIGTWAIILLPKEESSKLPSRGQVMVKGTINGVSFQTPLEPDGRGSHWFRVDEKLSKNLGVKIGDTVSLEIEPSKEWPEPNIPQDLKNALQKDQKLHNLWANITPMARWDWIRWIGATKNEGTRQHRIEVAFSKLKSGMKRPCCFNRTACTEPLVSKNGILLSSV